MKHQYQTVLLLVLAMSTQWMSAQYEADEWAERDTWMDVNVIFDAAGIEEGSYVADIGCHEGYLSVHLAKKVGHAGQVYAVDVRADRLNTLKENLEERNIKNVEVILGYYDNPKLPINALDVVVIMDTYHEMEDYMTILDHVHNSLKSGGRIVILEKLKTRIKGKSREAQTDAHSLGMKYVRRELKKTGFKEVYHNNDLGDWENDEDKVIWMLIAEKE
ncbi:MAG: class I SAM-dependent methyltransferase [Bacteroidota bacterium]